MNLAACVATRVMFALVLLAPACVGAPTAPTPLSLPGACYAIARHGTTAAIAPEVFRGVVQGETARRVEDALRRAPLTPSTVVAGLTGKERADVEWVLAWFVVGLPERQDSGYVASLAAKAFKDASLDPEVLLFALEQGRGDRGRADVIRAMSPSVVQGRTEESVFAFACDAAWTLNNYARDTVQYQANLYPTDLFIADQVIAAAWPVLSEAHRAALLPIVERAATRGVVGRPYLP